MAGRLHKIPFFLGTASLLSGCDPLLSIQGSFWPPWIVAILTGLVLTVLASWCLGLLKLSPYLGPPLLIYPSLWALLTFCTWLAAYT
jgi:hypothetical protein